LAALVVAATGLMTAPPAAAKKVGNPGSGFTLKMQGGFLRFKDNSFDFEDENRLPQCSDGRSNDDDAQDPGGIGAIDYPADPQCGSAADDSEVQTGIQPKLPIQATNGTVTAAGAVTFPKANIFFPPQYIYVPPNDFTGAFILTLTVTATQDATGTIVPSTGAMTLALSIQAKTSGYWLADGCTVGPINLNLTTGTTAPPLPNTPISGVPYDPATGRVTLVDNAFAVPGASSCLASGTVNSELGLPAPAGNSEAQFRAQFTAAKPQVGVVANFATTPNPAAGIAPFAVGFNATGSSTGTYQWDFTNNGSFDATGLTTSFTYGTPGSYTARLRVTDSDGDFAETTRPVTVGVNQPPSADPVTVSTNEDNPVAFNLLGSDPENLPLAYATTSAPAHGTLSGTAPSITYTPAANFNGSDGFMYRVTDNFGTTVSAPVTITVNPVNDRPVASDIAKTTLEDVGIDIPLVASDVDGTPLTFSNTPPQHGTYVDGRYTPTANYHGPDSFTYTATDEGLTSNTATVTITVTSDNDLPQANDVSVSGDEDGQPVTITLAGTDADGDALTPSVETSPRFGTLGGGLTPGTVRYTPGLNFNGDDSFTFKVQDPAGAFDIGTVNIHINPTNDAPVVQPARATTPESTPVDIVITASDIDGDELGYTASSPGHGTVTCAGSTCTYTPASGFTGVDSFTVTVDDGHGLTASAPVSVRVATNTNAAPVLADGDVLVTEDTPLTFLLDGHDTDGDALEYTVVTPPALGTLSCTTAGSCTYTPVANSTTAQPFQVKVIDGWGGEDTATLTLRIQNVNDAPDPGDMRYITNEDTAVVTQLLATDADGNALTWRLKTQPAHGSVTCAGDSCTYTPAANYNSTTPDSFGVEVDDGSTRVQATVYVTTNAVNDAPTALPVSASLLEDTPATFDLRGTDDDGDALFYTASPAALGTLNCLTDGRCSYSPRANANGVDTVAYTVTDNKGPAVTGSIRIEITAVNDAPTAANATVTTREDTPMTFRLPGTDVDAGDQLTFALLSVPAQGSLSGTAPDLTYTPVRAATGDFPFQYSVTDAAGQTSSGWVTLHVNPVNQAPVANSTSATTPEDTPKPIALTGTDAEDGQLTGTMTTPPAHGTYVNGTYTPAANYNGPDSIGFSVKDRANLTSTGTISITVTPVNDAPVASAKSVTTTKTVPVSFVLAASDPDGDVLTWAVTTAPTHGTLSGTAPNLTYSPTGTYYGSDSFVFRVTDPAGRTASATVSITIGNSTNVPTTLTLGPARVVRNSNGTYTYQNLTATLKTANGTPISGKTISFYVNGTSVGTGVTNTSGVATTTRIGPAPPSSMTYTATYSGGAGYGASSGTGSLS
jgi:hypothetical protein